MKKKNIVTMMVLLCVGGGNRLLFAEPRVSERERCVATEERSPFALDVGPDVALFSAGGALSLTGFLMQKNMHFPDWDGHTYDSDSLNYIDSVWHRPYSKTLDNIGTASCAVNLAVIPVTVFALETGFGNLPHRELLTIGAMYAESWLFAYGTRSIIKAGVQRVRPYMYTDHIDKDAIKNHDFEFSFPSGHTTDAFMGASFVSYVFCTYYPDSKWKPWVIAGSYTFAAATGLLRISSGNHFITDVLAGAALGTFVGMAVPYIHTRIAATKNKTHTIQIGLNSVSATFYF